MTVAYRPIDITPFASLIQSDLVAEFGTEPKLMWIDIAELVVDPRYQRDISRQGAKNVVRIANNFSWQRFGTVLVSRAADGADDLWAIIDGQHRVTGAALRGIQKVPCMLIDADPAQQAGAFAAINGLVTKLTPLQIHAARVAAGDDEALDLVSLCAEGGVTICRYPVPGEKMVAGETLAVGTLEKLRREVDRSVLVLALQCITKTGENVGLVRTSLVKGLCSVFDSEPGFASKPDRVLKVLRGYDFGALLDNALIEGRRSKLSTQAVVTRSLYQVLDRALMAEAA
jgi:hypothetical protein